MAVALDGSSGVTTTASSVSFTSHTVAGTDRVGYCGINFDGTTDLNPTGTYAGVAFGAIIAEPGAGTGQYIGVMHLVAPATGANTVALSSIVGGSTVEVIFVTFTGADQTTPHDAAVTGVSTTAVASPTNTGAISTTTGDLVFDLFTVNNAAVVTDFNPGASQTTIAERTGGGTGFGTSYLASNGSVTMSWSWTHGNNRWGHIVLNLNASGGAPPDTAWYPAPSLHLQAVKRASYF